MNNYIEYFTNYVFSNYDMSNRLISLKYYHSLRVAWIMSLLASHLNMSEEDILLAFKLGLCHDLGRFYEVFLEGQFNDLKFDHASYSNKILYNDLFVKYMDIDEHLLFRKAIYNHNKQDITKDLNNREFIFTNLLRDADKIDILGIRGIGKKLNFNSEPNTIIIDRYTSNKSLDLHDVKSDTDRTIFYLSFCKDLYYQVSHDLINKLGYIDIFTNTVNVDNDKKELFDELIKKINEERGKVYVR